MRWSRYQTLVFTTVFATLPLAAGFALTPSAASAQNFPPVVSQPQPDFGRLSALERQLREMTNQLEQRDFQLRQLEQSFNRFTADTNARLEALERASNTSESAPVSDGFNRPVSPVTQPVPQPSAVPMPTPLGESGAPLSQTQGSAAEDPNAPFKPSETVSTLGQISGTQQPGSTGQESLTSGRPQTTTPAQAYDQAFSYLQQNNYIEAQRSFNDFLKNNPKHPLAANAQFWLGETYFAQSQYQTAAKIFAKSFQDHPQGQKAPDSLLKLALTLEKLNKKDDACLTLQELGKRFTSGPASVTKRAGEEGQRMGCKS